ncbi:copper chaperone CopZ [Enterococcus sp. MJM12]|uniref:Copper chaperone CopZ n=1 Tax=Candidatus Enterococcus myersii TaxID=2815322 RepID=A0ABS3H9Y4_9ENTE|nr:MULTISPECIES: copper chaperone CopZ [Enterococcus]MBO0450275.1 copper chaperone CopZ [Enterococcus sp. MJM12]MCD1023932.1 copper chaperone CopZ [Enterococcus sp. SMC-9]MDT2739623.1 copper chaperone CopZ [Enterococcus canintestini]WHA10084.1 copper chaperone CopZ [Enterococcus montenegrensis]
MKQTFNISGMSCGHCVAKVEGTINELPGVKKVKINLKKNNGVVKYDDSQLTDEKIIAAVTAAGYPTEVA